jgi:hypothetical protein
MALQDLEGKRTGRPRGAKTSSQVWRDLMWVYRNLDRPDAKPPTNGARMWMDYARTNPGDFLACVLRADVVRDQSQETRKPGAPAKPPQRVQMLCVPEDRLINYLKGSRDRRITNLPSDCQIVSAVVGKEGLFLTIRSASFCVVFGDRIPEFAADFGPW